MDTFQKQVLERWKRLVDVVSVESDPYRVLHADLDIPKHLQDVKLSGKSLWGNESGIAKCTKISLEFHFDNPGQLSKNKTLNPYYIMIYVEHNRSWEIYTDKAFEKGISEIFTKILGGKGAKVKVFFTEQGMQDNGTASMENCSTDWVGSSILADFIMGKNDL